MAVRTNKNISQQNYRANLPDDVKKKNTEKNTLRMQIVREKKNSKSKFDSTATDDSIDNSVLKRRKISDEDDINCDDDNSSLPIYTSPHTSPHSSNAYHSSENSNSIISTSCTSANIINTTSDSSSTATTSSSCTTIVPLKDYNFFHHKPQSESSSIMTYQPILISSNVVSDKTIVLSITQNVQPPTEVRNKIL